MAAGDYSGTGDGVLNASSNEDAPREIVLESEPLLHDGQREGYEGEEVKTPSPWRPSSKSRIPMVVYLICLMTSLELEESIQAVPTVRLYESAICQQYYNGPADENKCKIGSVQQKLAWVRGWQGLFDALPSEPLMPR
jgi:hypothetical protein